MQSVDTSRHFNNIYEDDVLTSSTGILYCALETGLVTTKSVAFNLDFSLPFVPLIIFLEKYLFCVVFFFRFAATSSLEFHSLSIQ